MRHWRAGTAWIILVANRQKTSLLELGPKGAPYNVEEVRDRSNGLHVLGLTLHMVLSPQSLEVLKLRRELLGFQVRALRLQIEFLTRRATVKKRPIGLSEKRAEQLQAYYDLLDQSGCRRMNCACGSQ